AAAVGAQVDAAVHARVAGERLAHVAPLVLVVVDPDPAPARVVGAVEAGDAVDGGDRVDGHVVGAGRGLAEADVHRAGDAGDLGEGGAAVGRVPQPALARQPDVALVARDGLELAGLGQPGGGGGGERRAAVRADVEAAAGEPVELRGVLPVGLDDRVRGQALHLGPGVAEADRVVRGDAARRPDEAGAVGRRRDRAALVDPAGLGALEPVGAAVGGEGHVAVVRPVGVGEVAGPDHDRRVPLGVVEAGGGGEVRRGEHHGRDRVQVRVPEPGDV